VDAYEGCKNTEFTFTIPTELPYDYTVTYTVTGSATMGVDFNTVATSIVIPEGETSAILDITTLFDGTDEGLESIVVTIIPADNDTTFCPHTFVSTAQIADVLPVTIAAAGDTGICNYDVLVSSIASGGYGPLSYNWNNGGGSGPSVFVKPPITTTYTVTVTDSCGTSVAKDSTIIEVDCEYLFHIPNAFTLMELTTYSTRSGRA